MIKIVTVKIGVVEITSRRLLTASGGEGGPSEGGRGSMGCRSKLHCILTWSQFSEQSQCSPWEGSAEGHHGAEVVCGMGVGWGCLLLVEGSQQLHSPWLNFRCQ